MAGGWGESPWGAGEWGAGAGAVDLCLTNALAVRENVVRLTFNAGVYFTAWLDPFDASVPERYAVTPVDTSPFGLDGLPPRPVAVVRADLALVPLSFGAIVDVTVDRPFSPWPSEYVVAVNGLVSTTGALLLPGCTSLVFAGLYRALRVQSIDAPAPSRDIANPNTVRDQAGILAAGQEFALGTIPIGSDGDYAFDQGLVNLRKRIFRRLLTRPGAFAHMPTYGVGVASYGKRLGTAAVRAQLAAAAEQQIRNEPDVREVKVSLLTDPLNPSIVRLNVNVRTIAGLEMDLALPLESS